MASKVTEAEGHLKSADKCLKTSLMKWKPDYDGALECYKSAATCYKAARKYKEAIETLKLAADIQENQTHSTFHAAKSLESAALLAKELQDWKTAGELIQKAGFMLREAGTPDSASMTYEKGAKMIEDGLPEKSAELYILSAEACDIEDKFSQSSECMANAGRMLVRIGQLDRAVDVLTRRIDYCLKSDRYSQASKGALDLILVQLTRDDFVAARKVYDEALGYHGFPNGDDAAPLTRLLQAFDEQDGEAAGAVLQDPIFKYNTNEFAKLSRDMKLPGGGGKKKTAAAGGGGGGGAAAGDAQGDEDEDEGLLC